MLVPVLLLNIKVFSEDLSDVEKMTVVNISKVLCKNLEGLEDVKFEAYI
ncbi:predicted protein [Sclerotinia sclerotiorum 1980 UF-70]|uniref:Uncharacterized protein n=1 Tax=Sclerotinia sclerotiorum (strain ATCC 18683 / 1980 / Ss-1) TaxID=665079 RepID=A7F7N5_SCLS1|nr:predicted protein [Sclerotinia sclerotiorum 1980 UF-70]EDN98756.1 predicted protein [Sclerotinia sclerotiorum 1980 UF-70]